VSVHDYTALIRASKGSMTPTCSQRLTPTQLVCIQVLLQFVPKYFGMA
jgi:hypothetical protein